MSILAPVLAIDPGERYYGIAASDDEGKMAFVVTIIDSRQDTLIDELKRIVSEREIRSLVIGKPSGLQGTPLPMTKKSEELAKQLGSELQLPVAFIDERLSTKTAKRHVEKGRRPDAAAAALLLQTYLDSAKHA